MATGSAGVVVNMNATFDEDISGRVSWEVQLELQDNLWQNEPRIARNSRRCKLQLYPGTFAPFRDMACIIGIVMMRERKRLFLLGRQEVFCWH